MVPHIYVSLYDERGTKNGVFAINYAKTPQKPRGNLRYLAIIAKTHYLFAPQKATSEIDLKEIDWPS